MAKIEEDPAMFNGILQDIQTAASSYLKTTDTTGKPGVGETVVNGMTTTEVSSSSDLADPAADVVITGVQKSPTGIVFPSSSSATSLMNEIIYKASQPTDKPDTTTPQTGSTEIAEANSSSGPTLTEFSPHNGLVTSANLYQHQQAVVNVSCGNGLTTPASVSLPTLYAALKDVTTLKTNSPTLASFGMSATSKPESNLSPVVTEADLPSFDLLKTPSPMQTTRTIEGGLTQTDKSSMLERLLINNRAEAANSGPAGANSPTSASVSSPDGAGDTPYSLSTSSSPFTNIDTNTQQTLISQSEKLRLDSDSFVGGTEDLQQQDLFNWHVSEPQDDERILDEPKGAKAQKCNKDDDAPSSVISTSIETIFDAGEAVSTSNFIFTKFGTEVSTGVFTFGSIADNTSTTTTANTRTTALTSTIGNEQESRQKPIHVTRTQTKRSKEPILNQQFPSKVPGYELKILEQPEEQHRARYLTEGSRGAVKNRSQQGNPVVKLIGVNEPCTLQVFIGNDSGRVRPHGFYQACKVCGKNSTSCSEKEIDGTVCIEIEFKPANEMVATIDCVGILKLRNADVEQRIGISKAKKKSTKARIVFRTNFQKPDGVWQTLQIASHSILCTQPIGQPEICRMSRKDCTVKGGEELFLIGKNFLRGTKVFFQEITTLDDETTRVKWQQEADIDKDHFQPTHLICTVPEYTGGLCASKVRVQVVVHSGGKRSDPQMFWYLPDVSVKLEVPMEVEQYTNTRTTTFSCVAPEALELNKQIHQSQQESKTSSLFQLPPGSVPGVCSIQDTSPENTYVPMEQGDGHSLPAPTQNPQVHETLTMTTSDHTQDSFSREVCQTIVHPSDSHQNSFPIKQCESEQFGITQPSESAQNNYPMKESRSEGGGFTTEQIMSKMFADLPPENRAMLEKINKQAELEKQSGGTSASVPVNAISTQVAPLGQDPLHPLSAYVEQDMNTHHQRRLSSGSSAPQQPVQSPAGNMELMSVGYSNTLQGTTQNQAEPQSGPLGIQSPQKTSGEVTSVQQMAALHAQQHVPQSPLVHQPPEDMSQHVSHMPHQQASPNLVDHVAKHEQQQQHLTSDLLLAIGQQQLAQQQQHAQQQQQLAQQQEQQRAQQQQFSQQLAQQQAIEEMSLTLGGHQQQRAVGNVPLAMNQASQPLSSEVIGSGAALAQSPPPKQQPTLGDTSLGMSLAQASPQPQHQHFIGDQTAKLLSQQQQLQAHTSQTQQLVQHQQQQPQQQQQLMQLQQQEIPQGTVSGSSSQLSTPAPPVSTSTSLPAAAAPGVPQIIICSNPSQQPVINNAVQGQFAAPSIVIVPGGGGGGNAQVENILRSILGSFTQPQQQPPPQPPQQ